MPLRGHAAYAQVALHAGGTVLAVALLLLLRYGWGVLASFQEPLLWAWLCSLPLCEVKRYLVTTARRELLHSSLVVCAFKLLFLPGVILWQLFVEVREQLQAKYKELQAISQAGCTEPAGRQPAAAALGGGAAAPAAAGARRSLLATVRSMPQSDTTDSLDEGSEDSEGPGPTGSPRLANGHPPSARQRLSKGQQQLRQRRPAAAATGAHGDAQPALQQQRQQHKHKQQRSRPPLGPKAAGSKAAAGPGAAPQRGAAAAATSRLGVQAAGSRAATRSWLQRLLRRLRHAARRQLRWYLFCLKELGRLVLRSLIPRQQQQQQPVPGWPLGAASGSDGSAAMRPSLAGSYSSSVSECSLPWAPQPAWQQLLQPPHGQQGQLQPHSRRISSSASSPSLHADASGSHVLPSPHAAAGNMTASADAPALAALDRGLSTPAPASFSGWSSQPQPLLSRCNSTSSSTGTSQGAAGSLAPPLLCPPHSTLAGAKAAAAPGAVALGGPSGGLAGLASPAASLGALGHDAGLLPPGCAHAGGSGPVGLSGLPASAWDSLLPGSTAPGSVMGMGSGNGGTPSGLLFKWLLRGIVLHEGFRFLQGLWAEQPVLPLLLLLGGILALAVGLPLLLLPASVWGSGLHDREDAASRAASRASQDGDVPSTAAAAGPSAAVRHQPAAGRRSLHSPFQQQAAAAAAAAAGGSCPGGLAAAPASCVGWLRQAAAAAWSGGVQLLVQADARLRAAFAGSFLDQLVSGLLVAGLVVGSVVLGVVMVVSIGDESRQAVVSLNSLVRQKGTEAGLAGNLLSMARQYEAPLVHLLDESLPRLTHLVESRASDLLARHNLTRVLLEWESMRAALRLPADCSPDARVRVAVALANNSLAEAQAGQQRSQLQQHLDVEQQRLGSLAAQLERAWLGGGNASSSIGASSREAVSAVNDSSNGSASSSSNGSSSISQQLLDAQQHVARLQEQVAAASARHEAAGEQRKLAELRLRNCQPAATPGSASGAGMLVGSPGRGLLSGLLGGFRTPQAGPQPAAEGAGSGSGVHAAAPSTRRQQGEPLHPLSDHLRHARRALRALVRLDLATASSEAAAVVGHLVAEPQSAPSSAQHAKPGSCAAEPSAAALLAAAPPAALSADSAAQQVCPCDGEQQDHSSSSSSLAARAGSVAAAAAPAAADCPGNTTRGSSNLSAGSVVAAAAAAAAQGQQRKAGGSGSTILRAAQATASPLMDVLRSLSSVLLAGVGSTTALALSVLRLGLGVAQFLMQLGVFSSVLFTLLALDIDPVERLAAVLPISEASQQRASRAVNKALRGVFVSSLKLALFHAGFTFLTLRCFRTHFVATATVLSALVGVLPLVPSWLCALPAVLELALLRGAPVSALVLAALHLGAYWCASDLCYREVEPTVPYLIILGVFGGMGAFSNPLQGALLGPMVLALLSCVFSLHRELLAAA